MSTPEHLTLERRPFHLGQIAEFVHHLGEDVELEAIDSDGSHYGGITRLQMIELLKIVPVPTCSICGENHGAPRDAQKSQERLRERLGAILRDHGLVYRDNQCGDLTYVVQDLFEAVEGMVVGSSIRRRIHARIAELRNSMRVAHQCGERAMVHAFRNEIAGLNALLDEEQPTPEAPRSPAVSSASEQAATQRPRRGDLVVNKNLGDCYLVTKSGSEACEAYGFGGLTVFEHNQVRVIARCFPVIESSDSDWRFIRSSDLDERGDLDAAERRFLSVFYRIAGAAGVHSIILQDPMGKAMPAGLKAAFMYEGGTQ